MCLGNKEALTTQPWCQTAHSVFPVRDQVLCAVGDREERCTPTQPLTRQQILMEHRWWHCVFRHSPHVISATTLGVFSGGFMYAERPREVKWPVQGQWPDESRSLLCSTPLLLDSSLLYCSALVYSSLLYSTLTLLCSTLLLLFLLHSTLLRLFPSPVFSSLLSSPLLSSLPSLPFSSMSEFFLIGMRFHMRLPGDIISKLSIGGKRRSRNTVFKLFVCLSAIPLQWMVQERKTLPCLSPSPQLC